MLHRGSVSSTRDRHSPALSTSSTQKRPLSPGSEENVELKRSRVDLPKRRVSSPPPPGSKVTPVPSTRPSPIPFRTQGPSSPEIRQTAESNHSYRPGSPLLPPVLPPHPRPVGSGMAPVGSGTVLPPFTTKSPASSAASPGREDDRMQIDTPLRRSVTPPPPSRAKISDVMNAPNKSPTPPSNSSSMQSKDPHA